MDILPCPFCGGGDLRRRNTVMARTAGNYIDCLTCDFVIYESKWNTRANRWAAFTDEELKSLVEALEPRFGTYSVNLEHEIDAELESRKATSV